MLTGYGPTQTALLLFAFALAGALTGWILARLLQQHVDDASLDWCRSTILPDETVVIARVRAEDTPRVLAILRDVETEAPVTFSFYSPPPLSAELTTRPLWPERPSGQRLAENAARLARSIAVSRKMEPRGPSFLRPPARDRANAGMGERQPDDGDRSAADLRAFVGVVAR